MYTTYVYLVYVPLLVSCTVVYDESKHEISSSKLHGGVSEATLHDKNNKDRWYARANYQESFLTEGWDYLKVETNPAASDDEQAYFAGFIEGHVTHNAMYNFWYNVVRSFCDGQERFCEQANEYLEKNMAWTQKTSHPHRMANDVFWHQVELFQKQLHGLYEGYNHCFQPGEQALTKKDIVWMNFMTEIETLKSAFNTTVFPITVDGLTHCSGLIKLLPGYKDLLVSHVTWTGYHYMLRMIKKYDFSFHKSLRDRTVIAGKSMTFSGYPGVITSVDDFYVIKSGLVVLETTIGNSNDTLWQLVDSVGQVSERIRSMVANRVSRNGKEWATTFSQYNNGLYNNQWMIVDMNRFIDGQPPQTDTLWIVEQTPGYVESEDRTQKLVAQTYWPSYNVPSFPAVFKRMGNEKLVEKYGDWFSYENAPRAKIFRRDHATVQDVTSMLQLMRSNNYKNDPYSRCNCTPPYSAANAISCRDDLNPINGSYPFPALGHRNHGAIDAKVVNYYQSMRMEFYAVSGPTRGTDLPPFRWNETDFRNLSHLGQPNEFNFRPVLHTWN